MPDYCNQVSFYLMQILASGDDSGLINIWKLGGGGDGLIHLRKIDSHVDLAGGSAVTTLSLWNKVNQGTVKAEHSLFLVRQSRSPSFQESS